MRVIFLPGMDGSGLMYEALLNLIDGKCSYQVIALEQSGNQNYAAQAQLIADSLGNEKLVLFAESYSGYLAKLVTNIKPNNIVHIVFAASFITRPHPLVKIAAAMPLNQILRLAPQKILNHMCFANRAGANAFKLLASSLQTTSEAVLKERIRNMANLPMPDDNIDIPCTYIQPSRDFLVSKRAVAKLTAHCSNIEIINLAGGHFIVQSNPVGCAEVLLTVIERFK
ncbi:alpha/beta fold hydrolase [Catenovulum agarivorans]|uniref:alpha/beta fold hydrolase n=1 Tax=Catenovulum agarivorans TaxID=1172192 RepID=UPI000314B6D3|nr:alpha/beta hydrolase [Catenovulum agarivorans]